MMGNAEFNNARGTASTLQLAPPFAFKDVTMSVFPLRATLSRLESFCDAFLNHADEAIKFQPFIPYVYLIILDYGRMSVEAANMGWISQREVAFGVPLRWMQKSDEDGILEFRDWAFNSPFIFVDNDLSMSTGREVYGWPKMLAHLDPTISEWVQDPPGSRRVFNVSTRAVGQAYAGEELADRPFLNVYHCPATNIMEFPPNLLGMFKPLAQMPNIGLSGTRLASDLIRALSGIAAQGITKTSVFPDLLNADRLKELLSRQTLQECLKPSSWQPGLADLLWSLFPRFYANTINLKQFRDAASPIAACYQAITNAKMTLECVNRAGPLGQQNLLLGQIDGGYRIDIYRHANLPIIDALGLEVASSRQDGDVAIATLQPVCPFWMQVDMTYARGDVVAWRTSSTHWKWQVKSPSAEEGANTVDYEARANDLPTDVDEAGDVPSEDTPDEAASGAEVQTVIDFKPSTKPTDNLYNTTRGAGEELSGPFRSPDTTIRVLPLLADEATLDAFVSPYLDIEGYARYRAWGHHVYLVVCSYPGRSSESQNIGLIANREINFVVPVKCYDWYGDGEYDLSTPRGRKKLDREKMTGTAIVTPFSYVDDVTVAITSSEVEGQPTLHSAISSPPVRWMDSDGPDSAVGSALLDSSALVLPSLGVGAGARQRSFLNITTKPPLAYQDEAGWRQIVKSWGPSVIEDLARKFRQRGKRDVWTSKDEFRRARAFALEVLSGKLSIVSLTLKQFRDSWQTETACYQSLVQGRRKLDVLHEMHEIEQPLHVSITRFPTQPICQVLGLRAKHVHVGSEGIVDVFEALRPFWLRADLSKELGKNLYERVGHREWSRQQHAHQMFGWHPVTVKDLETMFSKKKLEEGVKTSGVKISYEQSNGENWERVEKSFEVSDIKVLKQLQQGGRQDEKLRHLLLWSRERDVLLMSHPEPLNQIDRHHVPDLAAYLASHRRRPTPEPISTLAECVGGIDPATILDSILSRQWARRSIRDANLGSRISAFTKRVSAQPSRTICFPRTSSRITSGLKVPTSWSLTAMFESVLRCKTHRVVWEAIENAKVKKTDKAEEKLDGKTYVEHAKERLPDWFHPGGDARDPTKLTSKDWG